MKFFTAMKMDKLPLHATEMSLIMVNKMNIYYLTPLINVCLADETIKKGKGYLNSGFEQKR
jgi:hypothetical protein